MVHSTGLATEIPHDHATRSTAMPLSKRLLAPACSILLTLGLVELELRWINYKPRIMDAGMYVANEDPLLPYRLQPNYSGICAGSEVRTDAQGNRLIVPSFKELRPGQKPERVVLLLGDSGVFGFGLKDSDTIASQLQNFCMARDLNYEVRNVGVSGYTSWNEYKALVEFLKSNSATEVVVLYMPNDPTFDNDYFGFRRGQRPSFWRNESRLHDLSYWFYSHIYVSYFVSDGLKRVAARFNSGIEKPTGKISFDEKVMQPALDYSMQALEKMAEICRERQIALLVGIYRDVVFLDDPTGWLEYENAIKRSLEHRGIRWFVAKSHTDKLQPGDIRVAWNDPHPSREATSLIAEDILAAVQMEPRRP